MADDSLDHDVYDFVPEMTAASGAGVGGGAGARKIGAVDASRVGGGVRIEPRGARIRKRAEPTLVIAPEEMRRGARVVADVPEPLAVRVPRYEDVMGRVERLKQEMLSSNSEKPPEMPTATKRSRAQAHAALIAEIEAGGEPMGAARASTLANLTEALERYAEGGMIPEARASEWAKHYAANPTTHVMNPRFLAAACAWLYARFNGDRASTDSRPFGMVPEEVEVSSDTFTPATDANLRRIAEIAVRALASRSEVPTQDDYFVIFTYAVWIVYDAMGEFELEFDADSAGSKAIPLTLDAPADVLAKAAVELGESSANTVRVVKSSMPGIPVDKPSVLAYGAKRTVLFGSRLTVFGVEEAIQEGVEKAFVSGADYGGVVELYESLRAAEVISPSASFLEYFLPIAISAFEEEDRASFATDAITEAKKRGVPVADGVLAGRSIDDFVRDSVNYIAERRAALEKAVSIRNGAVAALYEAESVAVFDIEVLAAVKEFVYTPRNELASSVDIFAGLKTSRDVPFAQISEARSVFESRAGFVPSVDAFSSFFVDAIAADVEGRKPTGRGFFTGPRSEQSSKFNVMSKLHADSFLANESEALVNEVNSLRIAATKSGRETSSDVSIVIRAPEPYGFVSASLSDRGGKFALSMYTGMPEDEAEARIVPLVTNALHEVAKDGVLDARSTTGSVRGKFATGASAVSARSFYFAVITQPALRNWIYINETEQAYSEKTLDALYHITSSIATASTDAFSSGSASRATFRFGDDPKTVNFITQSAFGAEAVAEVVGKAFGVTETIAKNVESIVAEMGMERKVAKKAVKNRANGDTRTRKIDNLKALTTPGTIDVGYNGACACKFQPIVVTEDERKTWEDFGREALEFKDRLFVCPDDKFRYPKANVLKSTKVAGTEFPCCFAREAKEERVAPAPSSYVATRVGRLDYQRVGKLPAVLKRLLSGIVGKECFRRGSEASANSFFHAVMQAAQTPKYAAATNSSEREKVAAAMRAGLASDGFPKGIFAQEFRAALSGAVGANNQASLDAAVREYLGSPAPVAASRVVRGVEIAIGLVRVFVFTVDPATGTIGLELPNSPAAIPPNGEFSKCVVVIRVAPNHYEPVVAEGSASGVFGAETTDALESVEDAYRRTIMFTRGDPEATHIDRAYVKNLTKAAFRIGEGKPVGMILDSHGNARAIVFDSGRAVELPFPVSPIAAPVANLSLDLPVSPEKIITLETPGREAFRVFGVADLEKKHEVLSALTSRDKRRIAWVVLQVVHWYQTTLLSNASAEDFDSYAVIENPETPTETLGVPRVCEKLPSAEEGIDVLEKSLNWRFLRGGKFWFPNRAFANRVRDFLARVHEDTRGMELEIADRSFIVPRFMRGILCEPSDFVSEGDSGTRAFVSAEKLSAWLAFAAARSKTTALSAGLVEPQEISKSVVCLRTSIPVDVGTPREPRVLLFAAMVPDPKAVVLGVNSAREVEEVSPGDGRSRLAIGSYAPIQNVAPKL